MAYISFYISKLRAVCNSFFRFEWGYAHDVVAETGVNRLLAQANLAWLKHPIDDPRIARMRENIQRVNALADTAPGFVWRYQEGEDATGVRVLDDPSILYNCTVWTDLDSLKAYIYRPDHGHMLRQRREWFRPPPHPPNAMWWVEPDTRPTVEESLARLDMLWRHGPTRESFTFSSVQ